MILRLCSGVALVTGGDLDQLDRDLVTHDTLKARTAELAASHAKNRSLEGLLRGANHLVGELQTENDLLKTMAGQTLGAETERFLQGETGL